LTEIRPSASEVTSPFADTGLDVRLENFEGPLDLLLYLIRKNDLDIYDIPISEITQEYLSYLELMKELNLESAGGFLVMASTLMQIKAQMLLPSPEGEGEEGPDPRAELMAKLLEYQRYKEAAALLATYGEKAKDIYYRQVAPTFEEEEFVLEASVFDLMEAFQRVLQEAPGEVERILREEIPMEVKIREILDRLSEQSSLGFDDLFVPGSRRLDLIVTFLALLELIRLKQIAARQSEMFGPIRIFRVEATAGTPMPAEERTPSSHGNE
jgi:segregation and condensation protein A